MALQSLIKFALENENGDSIMSWISTSSRQNAELDALLERSVSEYKASFSSQILRRYLSSLDRCHAEISVLMQLKPYKDYMNPRSLRHFATKIRQFPCEWQQSNEIQNLCVELEARWQESQTRSGSEESDSKDRL